LEDGFEFERKPVLALGARLRWQALRQTHRLGGLVDEHSHPTVLVAKVAVGRLQGVDEPPDGDVLMAYARGDNSVIEHGQERVALVVR